MNIAEVSKKYDLTQDTLRYYERVGLLPPGEPHVQRNPGLFGGRLPLGRVY